MPEIWIDYLNAIDADALALTNEEILAAVEQALAAQGRNQAVIEPRVHLIPESSAKGHFNVLRGYVGPLGVAGVKVVGDFVDNYKHGLPSELAANGTTRRSCFGIEVSARPTSPSALPCWKKQGNSGSGRNCDSHEGRFG